MKVTQSGSDWVVETNETLQTLEAVWDAGKFIVARVTVAPTGYPEAYWERYDAITNIHSKGLNFRFVGYPQFTVRDVLLVETGGWSFNRNAIS